MADECPIHAGEPMFGCHPCEVDASESDPRRVKPIDPETGRPLRHIPLRDLVDREKQRLAPPSDTTEETPA